MEYLILGIALFVILAVGGTVALLRSRSGPGTLEAPPEAPTITRPAPPAEEEAVVTRPAERPPLAEPVVAPEIELPPPSAGRLQRLRARLARSQSTLGQGLLNLLSRDVLTDDDWDEIEDLLISADVGVAPSRMIVEELRTKVKVAGQMSPDEVRALLREQLVAQIGPDLPRALHVDAHGGHPAVVMVVGVNGTGKTTTSGKLSRVLVGDGKQVLLGAADTFRAAAAEQLTTWGERVGARVVRGPEGSDPASVAFEAVKQGIQDGVDTVIIDTAGRLHTKTGLMDELGKVKRVIEKQATVDEVLLVLDATTGQNGLTQARVFAEVVNITGIALTKLDGTAKGGIVISVQRELGVPVKLVGLGEGPDDLAPFDPGAFVDAILG
ncbi:signal recognition particle-docking protein FtsY [Actinocorallia aurantiaca]|uniref:Signal recognition particle receptor FtsY n=1 Tax=Actinocorallia aurantiaca TaxID=46204 RepID=A0ABP6GMC8_9ACTN